MLFLHWFFTRVIVAPHAAHALTKKFVTETRLQNHTPIFKVHCTHLHPYQRFNNFFSPGVHFANNTCIPAPKNKNGTL